MPKSSKNPTFKPQNIWLDKASPSLLLQEYASRKLFLFVQTRKGYVYVMSHPDRVGLLKIGFTTKNPFERAKTLETAGILGGFEVLWVTEYANVTWAEAKAHFILKEHHKEKEYFKVTLEMAKDTLRLIELQEEILLKYYNRNQLLHDDFDTWVNGIDIDTIVELG